MEKILLRAKRSEAAEGGFASRRDLLLSQWVNQYIRRDPRPGPPRPWRSFKAYISEWKQGTVLKFSGVMVTLIKIVVLNFQVDTFKTSKILAIFARKEISTFSVVFCT